MQAGDVLLGRYALVREIGGGASCTVWEAEGPDGVRVAVKATSLEEAGWRAEVRDRFLREARLLRRVASPHLVGIVDVGETDDGVLLLVLELLEGETLAERIGREPPLRWREAVEIAIGVARGAAALHRAGVVHRDLKPGNVVLRRREGGTIQPTIIDLGISKLQGSSSETDLHATLTATGQILGTPEYMSHEQALGERDIDARSDVWSIGVMLFEMVARRRPFRGPNTNAILASIRRSNIPRLDDGRPEIPVALADIVARCIERDREARIRSAARLAAALIELLEGVEAEGRPPSAVPLAALRLRGLGALELPRPEAPAPAPLPPAAAAASPEPPPPPTSIRPAAPGRLGRSASLWAVAAIGLLCALTLAAESLSWTHVLGFGHASPEEPSEGSSAPPPGALERAAEPAPPREGRGLRSARPPGARPPLARDVVTAAATTRSLPGPLPSVSPRVAPALGVAPDASGRRPRAAGAPTPGTESAGGIEPTH